MKQFKLLFASLLLVASNAWAVIAQVGTSSTTSGSGTSLTVTRPSVQSASFLSLVVISTTAPSATPAGWTLDKTQVCTDAPLYQTNIYHQNNATAGTNVVTVNFAAGTAAMIVTEWSGMFSATVDKTAGNGNYTNVYNTGSTGTLTQSSELAIAGMQLAAASGTTITPPAGWVNQNTLATPLASSAISQITAATTALNPVWTATGGGNQENANAIVTYIPGSAPAAATLSSPGRNTVLSNSVNVTATSDTAGGTFYGVVTTSATPPTGAQIIAGSGGSIVAEGTTVAVSGANSATVSGLSASTAYYPYAYQNNGVGSNVVAGSTFNTLPPAPNITGTSASSPSNGASLTITGTAFGATQGTGGVTIGGATQSIVSWSDTSIVVTLSRGTNQYGVTENVIVSSNAVGAGNAFALASIQPQAGWTYITLGTPNATSAYRITSVGDLASGNQLAYDTAGGLVTVLSDGTFFVDPAVVSFNVEAWVNGSGWGATGLQTINGSVQTFYLGFTR